MKKIYIKPEITIIEREPLCSNGLYRASVITQRGQHVDRFDVVEKEDSEDSYDWGMDSWGGD